MRRGRLVWGVILLLVGGLLLLNNLGLLPVDFGQILWPSLIILAGLWILLRSRLAQPTFETQELMVPLEGAEAAEIKLQHGAGRIHLKPGAAAQELLSGTFVGGVTQHISTSGDRAKVDLSVPSGSWLGFPWGSDRGLEWMINLTEHLPIDLSVEAGAGELDLDLEKLQVSRLVLKTGASSSKVHLPAVVEHCQVKIEAGAASVWLKLPDTVGARVTTAMGLAELKIDPDRFHRSGNEYRTSDYDQSSNRIDIEIDAGVSSIEIA